MLKPLETDRIIFKDIDITDLADIHRLHSYQEVDKFCTKGIPKSVDETKDYLHFLIVEQKAMPRREYFWVLRNKEYKFLGTIKLNNSLDKFKLGEVHYKLEPIHWGKGLATEAVKAILTFGFNTLHLHRIEAGVAVNNQRAIRVLEKTGMTLVGLRKKLLPVRGHWVDEQLYGILEEEMNSLLLDT